MNERIRELMLEAGYAAPELSGRGQKLAKLIIWECIGEIYLTNVGDLEGKSYYLDKAAERLEKHFGVEE